LTVTAETHPILQVHLQGLTTMKTVLSLSLAAVLAVFLTACDSGSDVDDVQVKEPPATPIESPSKSRGLSQSDQSGQTPPPPKKDE
jgi:hypothetical protein